MNPTSKRDLTLGTAHLANDPIGRGKEVEQLHSQLGHSQRPLVITGVGGLGKTTLAQMYWQRYRAEYDCAAWLSTSALYTADETRRADNAEYFIRGFLDNTQLKANLQVTFNPLQKPVDQFRQMVTALANLGEGQHLLVIDNAPEAAAVYMPELSALTHWNILLTSRETIPNMPKLELDALPPDEAVELFERVYEQPARSESLTTLLEDIGYHTLTIELLAAYGREKRLGPPGLLTLLRQKGLMQLDDYEVSVPRYHQSRDIAAHLRDLFLLELSVEEQDILRGCCILPTSNVPLDPALASEDFLCNLLGKKDREKDFKKCLRRLAKLHWLVQKDSGYRCHPVIAETAKDQLRPDIVNCGVLIENVIRLLVPDEKTNEPQIGRAPFGPLGEAVFKGVWRVDGDFGEEDEKVARLAGWLGNVFGSSGEIYKSVKYRQISLLIRIKILPSEHPDLAISYNNLAVVYRILGEHQKSLEYCQKALFIWEKTLHPSLATSYNNLADAYGALGEYQRSLEYNQKAISIWEKTLPSKHPNLAMSYNNLAAAYHQLGDFQKCIEYSEKALSIQEEVLSPKHPDLAMSYNNLAETYRALRMNLKSLECHQKALSIWEEVLPPIHPDLATSYSNIGLTYGALGEHQKRLEYHQKALHIREKVLLPEHPDLAISYNNLAVIYQTLGDLGQAVDFMCRAVAIFEKSLPVEHPDVAMAKKNLAIMEEELRDAN